MGKGGLDETYNDEDRNEDDKVDEEDENGPAGEVIFGHVVVAGTDGAADGSPDVRELHGVEVSLE